MTIYTMDADCCVKEHPAWITRLAIALIQSSILDMQGMGMPENGQTAAEARQKYRVDAWRWCESRSEDITSFLWCCKIIGADPDYIRYAYLDGSINGWQKTKLTHDDDWCFQLKRLSYRKPIPKVANAV